MDFLGVNENNKPVRSTATLEELPALVAEYLPRILPRRRVRLRIGGLNGWLYYPLDFSAPLPKQVRMAWRDACRIEAEEHPGYILDLKRAPVVVELPGVGSYTFTDEEKTELCN